MLSSKSFKTVLSNDYYFRHFTQIFIVMLYGTCLKQESIGHLKVAYSHISRSFHGLEPCLSMSSVYVQRSIDYFTAIFGFRQRLFNTSNRLVTNIFYELIFNNMYRIKIMAQEHL